MAKQEREFSDEDEALIESQAQIEALQTAAADAEARATTARAELNETRNTVARIEGELAQAASAREAAHGELDLLRSELTAAKTVIRETAARYRVAKLASAPDVPAEMVPESEDLEEIDLGFEEAQRVVGQLREKLQEEALAAARTFRVPAGSPPRRAADVSSLSPGEKIKLGLQQAAEREGR
jgi:chromosome segregation ATPase